MQIYQGRIMKFNPLRLAELLNRRPRDLLSLFEGDPRFCVEELYAIPRSREETMIMEMAKTCMV